MSAAILSVAAVCDRRALSHYPVLLLSCYHPAVPIILFGLLLFVLLAFGGVVLLSLALRYRAGTSRRQGRRWVATINVWMTSFSAVFFLFFAFLISFWLGPSLRFALAGMGVGSLLGFIGLVVTRWESEPEGLFYTPSRWLALLITMAIGARLITAGGTPRTPAVRPSNIGFCQHPKPNLHRSRCRINRLLSSLRNRRAPPALASRATPLGMTLESLNQFMPCQMLYVNHV